MGAAGWPPPEGAGADHETAAWEDLRAQREKNRKDLRHHDLYAAQKPVVPRCLCAVQLLEVVDGKETEQPVTMETR